VKKQNWVWMPHPGHFVASRDCRFHLNTYVGGYVVSTVGEYEPCMASREISAKSKGIQLEGIGDARRDDAFKKLGWEQIGFARTYETMVFKAKKSLDKCCPFEVASLQSSDYRPYTNSEDATAGHMELCKKWADRN